MNETALVSVFVPVALMLLMLGLGLALELAELVRVARARRGVVLGLVAQLVVLPVLGVAVALGFGLEAPFALGFVVLTLCPGGALSSVICNFVRADVALSVCLTALSSVITPFTIPLFYAWAACLWVTPGAELELPILPTMMRLVAVTILPICIGLALQRWLGPDRGRTVEPPVRVLSIVLFVAVIVAIVVQNHEALSRGLSSLGATAVVLNLASMAVGVGLARAVRLTNREAITIGIEVAMQNVATATFVTATLLADSAMALPPAVYALVMLPSALTLGLASRGWTAWNARG